MYPTRLKYDDYDFAMQKNHDIRKQNYTLMPLKIYNKQSCIATKMQTPGGPSWPVAKGTGVSATVGNIIDVESELKGLTFDATKCPQKKYQPVNGQGTVKREIRHQTVQVSVDFTKEHKKHCSFHEIPSLILPKPLKF